MIGQTLRASSCVPCRAHQSIQAKRQKKSRKRGYLRPRQSLTFRILSVFPLMSTFVQLADCVFVITSRQRYEKIAKYEILYIQAEGAWVDIVTRAKTYRLSTNLGTVDQQLDDAMFCRVSRKHIVNLHHIESLRGNELQVQDRPVLIGRHYRENLLSRLPILQTRLSSIDRSLLHGH